MSTARSTARGRHARAVGARLGSALVLAAGLLVAAPVAGHAEDYPTWEDVQSARGDEQATQAQITRIETALSAAQSQAATTSRTALDAATAAKTARAEADAAAQRAELLAAQSEDAARALDETRSASGALAAGRYRAESAAPTAVRLFTAADPDELLTRLGVLDRLDETWATLARRSQADAALASTLRDQAAEAERARAALAADAERAAQKAAEAADTEATTVSGLRGHVDTLYAQLAALKDTTAETERRYWIGQQLENEPPPAPPAAPAPAPGGDPAPAPAPAPAPPEVIVDPQGAQDYARGALAGWGWGGDQFECLVLLWNRESGWRADAMNPSSGAYGIPQALPGEKMASAGPDWRTNGRTQVDWGLGYIADRYGSPCGAWQHSENTGWY
ncbi:hypothetical protein [Microbacterium resistens]|uniref:aggregation-promoting factor C-terminal-like domain-containing protein n=1 Tax=Microbacterium resistens TaxID=156977 RepID=UPI0027E2B3F5|nr:hypothetical protein [Microbacterium resistens]